jgi:hypothetical protein
MDPQELLYSPTMRSQHEQDEQDDRIEAQGRDYKVMLEDVERIPLEISLQGVSKRQDHHDSYSGQGKFCVHIGMWCVKLKTG